MAFSKRKNIGQTTNLLSAMVINGLSIAKGDSIDQNGGGVDIPAAIRNEVVGSTIGWRTVTGMTRAQGIIKIPLKNVIPAFSRVFRATLFVRITSRGTWPSNVVDGNAIFTAYGIRRPGFDFATCSWDIYKTSTNWDERGAKVGTDLTSQSVGSFQFTQADFDSMGSVGEMYKQIPLTSEIAYRIDRNEDSFIMLHVWSSAPPITGNRHIQMENPQGSNRGGQQHTYLEIEYVPPIVFHATQLTSGRPIDLSRVLDAESFESQFHVYGGFIDQGETGEVVKYAIRNTRTERIARRLVIEATRSMSNTPTANVANTGDAELRSVDTFNLTMDVGGSVTKLTPRGRWELRFTSATNYDVYFDENFSGVFSLVIANRAIGSDETVQFGGKDAIRIRADKWSGTPANLDKFNFETVSDTTSPSYPTDSKDMMFLIPPTIAGGDIADTAKKRSIKGTTQQTRASSYVVNDGGLDRTVVPLIDAETQGFSVGQKAVIFSGTQFEEVTIRQIYNTAAALPGSPPSGAGDGDAVMLEEETAQSYAAGSFFTTGLYINQLEKSDDTFVGATGAAQGQAIIPVSPAVSWAVNDEFTAVKLSSGQVQDMVVQANNGGSITASQNLTFALAAGDLLIRKVSGNWASFFFQGQVPDGALLGDRFAILRAYEARSSLKNIV